MNVIIQREKFIDIEGELPALFARHYDEMPFDKSADLDMDYSRYEKLEDLNVLHCLTARIEGEIVGYFFNMVVPHLHHKGVIMSASDIVFVLPENRNGTGAGLKLIKRGIEEMKALGVKKINMAARVGTQLNKLLPLLGFEHIENNYLLTIGE